MSGCLVALNDQLKQDLLKDDYFFVPEEQKEKLEKTLENLIVINKAFLVELSNNETKNRIYKSMFLKETKDFLKCWEDLLENIDESFSYILNEKRDFIVSNIKRSIKRNNKKDKETIQKNQTKLCCLNEESVFVDGSCDIYNFISDSVQEHLGNLDCLISKIESEQEKKTITKFDFEKLKKEILSLTSLLLNQDSLICCLVRRIVVYKSKYNSTKFMFHLN